MERTWRVGHRGRDQMYYEELVDGAWERIDIDGEMLMGRAHHVIYFATPERWRQYPAWASGRRDEIISRITSEFREPDYEYHGLAPVSPHAAPTPVPPTSVPPTPANPASIPPTTPRSQPTPTSGARKPAPEGRRALITAVLLLLAIGGAMGWLVTRGIMRGVTTYPSKQSYLRRAVSRAEEPAMFWGSIGVYAVIGAGTLTLGILGARAARRLE